MNKLGFGFLRYPKRNPEDDRSVDEPLLHAMVDAFLAQGGDYFDTAYTYQNGVNEETLRRALVERHPRNAYRVADKLPGYMVKSHAHCWDFLNASLRRCGLEYFDVYLLHGLNGENYELAEKYDQFGFLEEVRAAGKTRKTGFSYHDSADLLDRILTEHPEVDYVQLQINYLDWDSAAIDARRCYEIACKHGKPIIVMEPVKGGSLANPPREAAELLRELDEAASAASWAIRFASDLPQVEIVLSGMNTMEQLIENMRPWAPLQKREVEVLFEAADRIRAQTAVPCTACGYCLDGCPKRISIPRLFSLYNEYARSPGESWKMEYLYSDFTKDRGKAGDCVACGQCVRRCPQKIAIPEFLKKTAMVFEP